MAVHTFINYDFALTANCHLHSTPVNKVSVAGGGQLQSTAIVPLTTYFIQEKKFSSVFKTLLLHSYDIILGCDWTCKVSPITMIFDMRTLTMHRNGLPIVFTDHNTAPAKSLVTPTAMSKLLTKPVMGYIIQVYALEPEEPMTTNIQNPLVQNILDNFPLVFSEPTSLPPNRDCNHTIPLTAGAQPPNLRPYRVPHMQKGAMEEIIKKMIKSMEIYNLA